MADLLIIALAVGVFVAVARWKRPARPGVWVVLALLTVAWIGANLRDTGWSEELGGQRPPDGLDPLTRSLFYRGWPLAPFMVCSRHGNRFRPGGGEGLVLVFDLLVLFAGLALARFLGDRWPKRRLRS